MFNCWAKYTVYMDSIIDFNVKDAQKIAERIHGLGLQLHCCTRKICPELF